MDVNILGQVLEKMRNEFVLPLLKAYSDLIKKGEEKKWSCRWGLFSFDT